MVDWKIARRRDRCSRCETAFEEEGRHVSTLSLREGALAREDLCDPCWNRRGDSGEIFFWFTRRRSGRRGLSLDLPTLEQLFLHLDGREEPRILELRYVLCLLLMRKKRLRLVRVAREPRETLHVRRPRREETLGVSVCDLSPERMVELQQELVELFEGSEAGAGEAPPAPLEAVSR